MHKNSVNLNTRNIPILIPILYVIPLLLCDTNFAMKCFNQGKKAYFHPFLVLKVRGTRTDRDYHTNSLQCCLLSR